MRAASLLVGAIMVISGLIFLAQGLDLPFAPRSFMTADRFWVLIGAALAVAGVAVIARGRRRA